MSSLIMVIDTNLDLLSFFEIFLKEEGYCVLPSSKELSSLDPVKEARPDLLIIDPLPSFGLENWQVIRQLKQDPATAALPVIVCTQESKVSGLQPDGLTQDNLKVVFKPFDLEVLLTAIRRSLGEV